MDIRVILIVDESEERQAYLEALTSLGVQVDMVSSLREFHELALRTPYHGVVLDLKTKIKSPREEKGLVHETLEMFPVAQLKWEKRTGEIRALYFGQSRGGGTLEEFIQQECRLFNARQVRSNLRRDIHFNVILSRDYTFSEEKIERTVTINASESGCFIYSIAEWDNGSNAWFYIKELKDQAPILGEVTWNVSWGKAMKIPGIGVKFIDIRENQLVDIQSRFSIEPVSKRPI